MGVLWKGTASSLMGLFDKRSGEGRCWRQGSGSWPGPVNGPGFLWGEVLREKTWLTCARVRARGSGKDGASFISTPLLHRAAMSTGDSCVAAGSQGP